MIDLTSGVSFNHATTMPVDFGGVLRPATGAKILRLDRLGNRYKIAVTVPIGTGTDRKSLIAKLTSGKRQGIRINYPLQGVNQGSPGNPQVNGAGQSGTTLNIKLLTPGYVIQDGYWLSIVNAAGQHYLHNVLTGATASGGGTASVVLAEMLRHPFADSATVHLAAPKIEGLVEDDISWSLPVGRMIDGLGFTIEEAE